MPRRQLSKSKLSKNYLSLPPHVYPARRGFIFRYTFPPILRLYSQQWEFKVNLGTNLELAQIVAYRLNSQINIMKWELKALQNETDSKDITELYSKILRGEVSTTNKRLDNACNLLQTMTTISSKKYVDSIISQIILASTEIAPEDITKLRVKERLTDAVRKIEQPVQREAKKLSEVYNEWRKTKQTKGIKQSTEKVLNTVWNELKWFFGDVDVFSIRDSQMKDYYEFWNGNVPPLTVRAHKDKPILSYQTMKEKIENGELQQFVSNTHKQNMLVYIREFLEWGASSLRQTPYFPADYKTYLKEIKTPRKRRGNKRSLTDKEIITIRDYLLKFKEEESSSYGDIRWRYWIFQILLLTGARPREIGQLRVNDILTAETLNPLADEGKRDPLGMPCFLIAECEVDEHGKPGYKGYDNLEPKSVKNDGSERIVPIHPWLIEDGFLDYVASRRQNGAQQVFDTPHIGSNGCSARITKYYGRAIDSLFPDKKERNIKLYSTRNNFEEKILRISKDNYDTYICQRLTGRIPIEGSVEAYRDEADIGRLYEIIKQVKYEFMEGYTTPQRDKDEA